MAKHTVAVRRVGNGFIWVVKNAEGGIYAQSGVAYKDKMDCFEAAKINLPPDATDVVIDETDR